MERIISTIIFVISLIPVGIKAQCESDSIIYQIAITSYNKEIIGNQKNACFTIKDELVYPYYMGFESYRELQGLDSMMVNQLKSKNDTLTYEHHKSHLNHLFAQTNNIKIIGKDDLSKLKGKKFWNNYFKKYPCSTGLISVSAIGYNEGCTAAILYFESLIHGLAGSGCFAICEKKDDEWIVKNIVSVMQM